MNLTASTSRTLSTRAPQSRSGLRAIRSSTCRRDCRTRRSITARRPLHGSFICAPGATERVHSGEEERLDRGTEQSRIGHRCCWCGRCSNAVKPTFLPHVDFSLPHRRRRERLSFYRAAKNVHGAQHFHIKYI